MLVKAFELYNFLISRLLIRGLKIYYSANYWPCIAHLRNQFHHVFGGRGTNFCAAFEKIVSVGKIGLKLIYFLQTSIKRWVLRSQTPTTAPLLIFGNAREFNVILLLVYF